MDKLTVHAGGRPRKFQDNEQLQKAIAGYFLSDTVLRNEKDLPIYSLEGMCCHCGIILETLREYEQIPEFSATIKMARQMILKSIVERMATDKNPAGAIFHSKQHGYTDRQEIDFGMKPARTIDIDLIQAPDEE